MVWYLHGELPITWINMCATFWTLVVSQLSDSCRGYTYCVGYVTQRPSSSLGNGEDLKRVLRVGGTCSTYVGIMK